MLTSRVRAVRGFTRVMSFVAAVLIAVFGLTMIGGSAYADKDKAEKYDFYTLSSTSLPISPMRPSLVKAMVSRRMKAGRRSLRMPVRLETCWVTETTTCRASPAGLFLRPRVHRTRWVMTR